MKFDLGALWLTHVIVALLVLVLEQESVGVIFRFSRVSLWSNRSKSCDAAEELGVVCDDLLLVIHDAPSDADLRLERVEVEAEHRRLCDEEVVLAFLAELSIGRLSVVLLVEGARFSLEAGL